jgi:hypothetical protein
VTAGERRSPTHAARAVALRPDLWFEAAAASVALAPHGWWRRWPPLPLPDPDYWRFRMQTAYGGDGDAPPEPDDVVDYLEWRRAGRRRGRRALR